jgi:hypothetical protein
MEKRKPRIIKDKKVRGEWAESLFLSRASEHGLPVSKPWGDSTSYDCVVGRPGKFVAVQVKCTMAESKSGEGYICSACSSGRPYAAGSFDFLAAYVVPEDVWYIIPAKCMQGMKSLSLFTEHGKYEKYRESWRLLREASQIGEEVESGAGREAAPEEARPVVGPPAGALGRMEASMNFFRNYLERSGAAVQRRDEET